MNLSSCKSSGGARGMVPDFGETPKSTRGTRALPQSEIRNQKSEIRNSTSGFTLTELLVSMAILAGLILLLFSVVDGTTQTWTKSEQRVDAFREARAALFIIARDLQTMVAAPDQGPEPYPAPTPVQNPPTTFPTPLPTPNGIADYKYFFLNPNPTGNNDVTFSGVSSATYGDRLFFLTNAEVTGEKSKLSSVGYYLDYTATQNATQSISPRSFKLYRYFKGSDDTFTRLKAYTAQPPSPTLMTASSSSDEILARNVVDFRVVAYDRDFNRLNLSPTDPNYGKVTPYALDISITAFNYSIANQFSSEADWIDQGNVNNANSRQSFSTRVYLPAVQAP